MKQTTCTARGRDEKFIQENVNLSWSNASGIGLNNPYPTRALLPYPEFGIVAMTPFTGRSAYHALQTAFNKRMSNRWQAGATYTLGGLWSSEGQPLGGVPGSVPQEVPFTIAEDLGGPTGWTFAQSDQRHRAVFNGIWQVGRGFQVSGVHYFGAGNRAAGSYGGDRRNLGAGGELPPASGWHDRTEEHVPSACAESDGHSHSADGCRSRAAFRWT